MCVILEAQSLARPKQRGRAQHREDRGSDAVHQAHRHGQWEPDPLILDDQALIVHVRDRGLVVLTGCGHSGVVNIARPALKVTGAERLHAIIGGFHLSGPLFAASVAPTSVPASSAPASRPNGESAPPGTPSVLNSSPRIVAPTASVMPIIP